MKIGFIGLGIMGAGMAANLLKSGFEVRVWNRSAEKTIALLGQGAVLAATPAALMSSSSVSAMPQPLLSCCLPIRGWSAERSRTCWSST